MINMPHWGKRYCMPLLLLCWLLPLCACNRTSDNQAGHRHVEARDEGAPYDGIDISSHQGHIDWDKVSSDKNIRFVYVKATEGATYRSPHYGYNVTSARRHGILVGSYHYLTSTSSVRAQFENFSHYALRSTQDLIPMLDVEKRGNWSRSQLIDSVALFCKLAEEHYGCKPMIYSTMGFYNKNLAPHFNKYHLYIGRYSNAQPVINWEGAYTIWQYSETGIIPGIDAYVDLCRYRQSAWLDEILLP